MLKPILFTQADGRRAAKLLSSMVLITSLIACGGGGDDEDTPQEPHNFAGAYNLSMNKTADTCSTGVQQNIAFSLFVEQNGRTIKVAGGGQVLNGSVSESNDAFTASVTQTSNNIPVVVTLTYRTTGTKDLYTVVWDTAASAQGVTCRITYNGEARRQ